MQYYLLQALYYIYNIKVEELRAMSLKKASYKVDWRAIGSLSDCR